MHDLDVSSQWLRDAMTRKNQSAGGGRSPVLSRSKIRSPSYQNSRTPATNDTLDTASPLCLAIVAVWPTLRSQLTPI